MPEMVKSQNTAGVAPFDSSILYFDALGDNEPFITATATVVMLARNSLVLCDATPNYPGDRRLRDGEAAPYG